MSHQVLARKWRPQNFTDIVGQAHVVTAMVNALKTSRLHHAYLFSGTRGVGKTTIARVFAKALSCETGVTPDPCGKCEHCLAITEGRFVDLIEVDAASRTRVEDTRELLENIQYAPTRGRFKIYLIDEVHMLSGHSFNALLKTLEEPPEHVKFLLATTDPQKLPVTVLSRCLQFTLRHISSPQIADQLAKVLSAEQISYQQPALIQLAESASGSMRDALSLLDQAIAYSGGDITETRVSQMLGTVPSEQVDLLVAALCSFDTEQTISLIENLTSLNVDFGKLLDQLIVIFHAAAIAQAVPEYSQQVNLFAATITTVKEKISAEDIQLFYQVAITSRRDLHLAHSPKAGFEMAILRMIMFRPGDGDTVKKSNNKPASEAKHSPAQVPEKVQSDRVKKQSSEGESKPIQTAPSENRPTQIASSPQRIDPDQWLTLIERLQLVGLVKELAIHCSLLEHQENKIVLALAAQHESLMLAKSVAKLRAELQSLFGDKLALDITISKDKVHSPAQAIEDTAQHDLATAESSIDGDDFVQAMKRDLQAELIPGSVQSKSTESKQGGKE